QREIDQINADGPARDASGSSQIHDADLDLVFTAPQGNLEVRFRQRNLGEPLAAQVERSHPVEQLRHDDGQRFLARLRQQLDAVKLETKRSLERRLLLWLPSSP